VVNTFILARENEKGGNNMNATATVMIAKGTITAVGSTVALTACAAIAGMGIFAYIVVRCL
jgi:hypothetical protein